MRQRRRTQRRAFTLVELLIVIVIIGVLAAMLLPVITGAVRTTKNAAVTAEFNTLGAALESFRTKYGAYPPSRVMLSEDGYWNTTDTTPVPVPGGGADVTYGALATRSAQAIRQFWPTIPVSTSPATGALFDGSGTWYDFDGDGQFDKPATPGRGVILDGAECLAFFLGGIPLNVGTTADPKLSLSGFARGRVTYPVSAGGRSLEQPFRNALANGLATNRAYGEQRAAVGYEFKPNRLIDGDGDGFPEYQDYLAVGKPIAYFASITGLGYDPNDVNYPEPSTTGTPPATWRAFRVAFIVTTVPALGNTNRQAVSPAPNPYLASAANGPATTWQRPASYQLISPGADGLYGLGGQYTPDAPVKLPPEQSTATTNDTSGDLRTPEADNLTNFSTGTLGS